VPGSGVLTTVNEVPVALVSPKKSTVSQERFTVPSPVATSTSVEASWFETAAAPPRRLCANISADPSEKAGTAGIHGVPPESRIDWRGTAGVSVSAAE